MSDTHFEIGSRAKVISHPDCGLLVTIGGTPIGYVTSLTIKAEAGKNDGQPELHLVIQDPELDLECTVASVEAETEQLFFPGTDSENGVKA